MCRVVTFLLALVVAITATGPRAPAASAHRNELVFGAVGEFKNLNPLYLYGGARQALGPMVFNSLLGIDAHGALHASIAREVPSLANGGVSRDGLDITYHLRHDAKWADGEPLTSRDVLFTHQAVMNPRNTVAERYGDREIATIGAPDPYTVRVHLKRSFSPFVAYFDRPLLPAHLLDKFDSLDKVDYNQHPIGSGPYRVAEWARGDHITFVASDAYWGPRAHIAKVVVHFIPDANTLVAELQSHDINAILNLDPTRVKSITGDSDARVVKTPEQLFGLFIFNTADPRLADVRVRRAFILGIDRAQVIQKATDGLEYTDQPSRALFGWAYDPSVRPLPYDPKAAAKLLDAAGWKLGADGVRARGTLRLEFNLAIQAGHPVFAVEAAQVAEQAKALGIALDIKASVDQQFALLTAEGTLAGGHFDISLTRFVGGEADPDPDWLIGCDETGKPNAYNFTHMCLPGMAPVLSDAVATFDVARRKRDYAIVQRALNEQLPLVLISQSLAIDVVPKGLHGFVRSEFGGALLDVGSWTLQ
jgi:peptide/nickel transport system substrate-binding protein